MTLILLTAVLAVSMGATAPLSVVARAPAPGARWAAPLGPPLVLLRPFSPPPAGTPWLPGHRGVDLAGAAGAPVHADAAGRVIFAGRVAGRGVVVVAHSSRLRSTFEPVRALVGVGDPVVAGDEVGRLERPVQVPGPGPACPGQPCLHWGMLLDGQYVDPLVTSGLVGAAAAAGPARLLPLDGPPQAGVGGPPIPAPVGRAAPVGVGRSAGAAAAGSLGGGPPGPGGGGAVLATDTTAAVVVGSATAAVGLVRRRRGRGRPAWRRTGSGATGPPGPGP